MGCDVGFRGLDTDLVGLCEVVFVDSVSAWRYDLLMAGCWFDFCGARKCVIVFAMRRVMILSWIVGWVHVLAVVMSMFVGDALRLVSCVFGHRASQV